MPNSSDLHFPDEVFRSLIVASNCCFILLVLQRAEHPLGLNEISSLLALEPHAANDMIDLLVNFGMVSPAGNGDKFSITQSGDDTLSSNPDNSPLNMVSGLNSIDDSLTSNTHLERILLKVFGQSRGKYLSGNIN